MPSHQTKAAEPWQSAQGGTLTEELNSSSRVSLYMDLGLNAESLTLNREFHGQEPCNTTWKMSAEVIYALRLPGRGWAKCEH